MLDVGIGAGVNVASAPFDFEGWYEESFERVARTLTVVLGDVDVASDATSEAFARAFARRSRIGGMDNRDGWVYRTALNVARRRHRREAIEQRLFRRQHPVAAGVLAPVDQHVWDAVATLPLRQREAIALRYLADMPEKEVAAAMGVAVGTASATLSAARRRLADLLGDEDG